MKSADWVCCSVCSDRVYLHEQEGGVVVRSVGEGAAAAIEFEPGDKVHGTRR